MLGLSHKLLNKVHSMVNQVGKSRMIKPLTITFKRSILVSQNSKNFDRSFAGMPNFKERMRMFFFSLTSLAKVKIVADSTFVSDSFNATF